MKLTNKKFDKTTIISDYDGTFAEKTGIPEENCDAVKRFLERDQQNRFVVLTARPPASIKKSLAKTSLAEYARDRIDIAGFNGALSYCQRNIIQDIPIREGTHFTITDRCDAAGINVVHYDKKNIYVTKVDDWMRWYSKMTGYKLKTPVPVDSWQDPLGIAIFDPAPLTFYMMELKIPEDSELETFPDSLGLKDRSIGYTRFTPPFPNRPEKSQWIQVNPTGVDKGKTVHLYSKKMGVNLENMMVIGDGINDLSALIVPGCVGVTFENADKRVVEQLIGDNKYIAPATTENGFATALDIVTRGAV